MVREKSGYMSEDVQKHKHGVAVNAHGEITGTTQFIKRIATAVARLENARRTIQMYPEGHEAIRESLSAAYSSLVGVFSHLSPLTIEVEKDCLRVANRGLDNRQPANKSFWTQLKHHGITGLSFHQDVSQKELHDFLKLFIGVKDQSYRHDVAFRKKVTDTLPHMNVTFVTYNGLGLTIEDEVSAPEGHDDKEGRVFKGKGDRGQGTCRRIAYISSTGRGLSWRSIWKPTRRKIFLRSGTPASA